PVAEPVHHRPQGGLDPRLLARREVLRAVAGGGHHPPLRVGGRQVAGGVHVAPGSTWRTPPASSSSAHRPRYSTGTREGVWPSRSIQPRSYAHAGCRWHSSWQRRQAYSRFASWLLAFLAAPFRPPIPRLIRCAGSVAAPRQPGTTISHQPPERSFSAALTPSGTAGVYRDLSGAVRCAVDLRVDEVSVEMVTTPALASSARRRSDMRRIGFRARSGVFRDRLTGPPPRPRP